MIIVFICLFLGLGLLTSCSSPNEQPGNEKKHIIANPLNLNYRFQSDDDPSRREAADPVIEYFNNKYYLFASKSGGYWSSPDLSEWTYIPCKTIFELDNYAPSILVRKDSLYFIASGSKIYRTANPDIDNWEQLDTDLRYLGNPSDPFHDPAFFQDDDGRVYLFWGCSDVDPIEGIELDPLKGFTTIGEPVALIKHNIDKHGWEVPGVNNEEQHNGWNEGPCVIKYKEKYYLQYAAPGTQFRIYGDGTYVSDNPLGPYTYVESSPFSFKPGGFIGGAGHGHTFKDKYGNYWHAATMLVGVRHWFERRIGLFPTYMSADDELHAHTVLTDYPFYIPNEKTDIENDNLSAGWNLLSYKKNVSASSSLHGYEADLANDEAVETWWAAVSGNKGEWWQVDLSKPMEINAVQVNFADHDFTVEASNSNVVYQYYIEVSSNGSDWKTVVDRTNNTKDMPHELIVLDNRLKTRYLRIKNTKDMAGKFSLYDLRVFGNGGDELPEQPVNIKVNRDKKDTRIIRLNWKENKNVTGYIVRWGVKENQLKNAKMVYENIFEGRFFNKNSDYWFSVDSFNENGITKGTQVVKSE